MNVKALRHLLLLLVLASTFAVSGVAFAQTDALHTTGFDSAMVPIIEGPCVDFYEPSFQLGQGRAPARAIAAERPRKGEVIAEPSFGTCLVRTTNHRIEYPQAAFLRNDYSRRQAFNADESLMFVFGSNGYWHLYNAATLAYVKPLVGLAGDAEPQWDPADPHFLYYVSINGGTQLLKLDVRTNTSSVVADFAGKLPAWGSSAAHIWTKSEGSPSADARYWGFQVEDGGFSMLGYMVWDLVEDRLVGARPTNVRPDHVSMSPSGRWFVSSGWEGTWAWSPDFSEKKKLHGSTEHSDIAIGANGHDMFVSIDYQSAGGDVYFTDIDDCPSVPADATDAPTCERTVLFSTYVEGSTTALHFSGKSYGKPGWVVISPYGTQPTRAGEYPWYANKVFAMELAADAKVYQLAEHRSVWDPTTTSYWFEPQATVSRDFTHIFYNSSWDSHDERDIEAFMLQLPKGALGGVGTITNPPPPEPGVLPMPITPIPPVEPPPTTPPPVPVVSQDGPCVDFYASNFNLAEGRDSLSVPAASRPVKGTLVTEPRYGTCLTRASDRRAEYSSAALMRNDYSRRQAFNADNSRYIVFSSNGWWHLYDANTMAYVSRLSGPAGDAEPQWHPTNPNILYYLPPYGGTKLYQLDISSNTATVAADFSGSLPAWGATAAHIWTKSEGSPSADGRYWGFQIEDGGYNALGYMVWDLVENRLVGSYPVSDRPDHVSMSPSGRWFVSSGYDGTWAWSPDFSQKKKLHHATEHSDIAIGANGNDMYVAIDYQTNAGDVFFTDIDACPAVAANASAASTPECPRTVLFTTYTDGSATALHISGKGYNKPGWVVVSTYGTGLTRTGLMPWYGDKVFAMELSATPRTYSLVHHHSIWDPNTTSYWFEPHATVSRDFTRVMFNSSWDSHSETDIDAYMLQIPANALPQ